MVLGRDGQRGARVARVTRVTDQARQQPLAQDPAADIGGHAQAERLRDQACELGGLGGHRGPGREVGDAEHRRELRLVEHDAHPLAAHPLGPRGGDQRGVGAPRDPAGAGQRVQPRSPRRHRDAGREAPVGPQVPQHGGEVVGHHEHEGTAAPGRPAARDEVAAQGVGAPGVADQCVLRAPRAQPRAATAALHPAGGIPEEAAEVVGVVVPIVGIARGGEVLGEQQRRHAQQLLRGQGARVDRWRAEVGGGTGAHELEVGAAPAGGAGRQDPLDQGGGDSCSLVEPAQQLQLLGAGKDRWRGTVDGAGPLRPRRRAALPQVGDPRGGPGRAGHDSRRRRTPERSRCASWCSGSSRRAASCVITVSASRAAASWALEVTLSGLT